MISTPDAWCWYIHRNGAGKSNVMVDAVAFACCCSPATLRVARLSDVQSTETRHPAEACHLCVSAASGACWLQVHAAASEPAVLFMFQVHLTMSCMQRRHHDCVVSCALTADGTRAYKLNGRNRSAREIKVHLSSTCTKPLCGSASLLLSRVCIQLTA